MGISKITALEIYSNPMDLEIVVGKRGNADKYAIGISRGPGHNYKALLTSEPFANDVEAAIEAVRNTLQRISEAVSQELQDPSSFAAKILNSDAQAIDQSNVLNPDRISQILDELKKNQRADTATLFLVKG